ncbi:PhnD/SsuA/transferrin family substrate-binding protein [Rhodobacteraceae bacterium CYK-10]|uniref:PhnD/SsuA/transferrin family substrate-binding protein n=2 Tax=Stagnihabitans tardus TaxID=2699202 RepID=A0AAE4YCD8_9RHOB|nr:PhnD/SsuA/transferrin family substrate-binding protein [Stagnihabitans tardus]NBZ89439.1 PhnD/SsuA/transferrin family substrate-binding protein [Stagnihabitans tardus]
MYDRAEVQPANDRLWALIRDGLRAEGLPAPEALTRGPQSYWPAWESPDLILSQTCGYPYRAKLHGRVTLLATPDYGVEGCPPGHYVSVYVARKDDKRDSLKAFDGAALAFNEDLSQSGWAGPMSHALSQGVTLRPSLRSGGHVLSARAVAEGRAEIAGIDVVTWTMITRHDAFAASLKVIARTTPTPGLPWIAAKDADADRLFPILQQAVAALSQEDRATLCLKGLTRISADAYLSIPTPPAPSHFGAP